MNYPDSNYLWIAVAGSTGVTPGTDATKWRAAVLDDPVDNTDSTHVLTTSGGRDLPN